MKKNPINSELTLGFLCGELSEKQEAELWRRIDGGEYPKAEFLKDQYRLKQEVIRVGGEKVDDGWGRLYRRIHRKNEIKSSPQRLSLFGKKFISIAAAFIVGVVISSAFYFIQSERFIYSAGVQEITIPYGAKTKLSLPDGSIVWVNSGSKLTYPQVYRGQRTVSLEGEAYFEVVKSNQPFVVSTKYGQVQVLGTSFNVTAFPNEEFQTTLVEGAVRFLGSMNQTAVLSPGENLTIGSDSKLNIKDVETDIYTSWKDGRLIFKREPFEMMAARLERWYNVKIDIENEELKNMWFTGTIEMETFTEFMELLVRSYPIHYVYDRNTRTLHLGKK